MVESKKTVKTTAKKTAVKPAKTEENKFSKLSLLSLSKFNTIDKDIIKIVLNDNEKYTLSEVEKAIKKFKEGI